MYLSFSTLVLLFSGTIKKYYHIFAAK